jgi:hypothetical protein
MKLKWMFKNRINLRENRKKVFENQSQLNPPRVNKLVTRFVKVTKMKGKPTTVETRKGAECLENSTLPQSEGNDANNEEEAKVGREFLVTLTSLILHTSIASSLGLNLKGPDEYDKEKEASEKL